MIFLGAQPFSFTNEKGDLISFTKLYFGSKREGSYGVVPYFYKGKVGLNVKSSFDYKNLTLGADYELFFDAYGKLTSINPVR